MRTARLALLISVFAAAAASAAVTNRSDAGFVYGAHNGPFATEGSACPGVAIASLPFTSAGGSTTCGLTNTITNYDTVCNANLPFPYPGPEAVFQLTLAAGNNVAFSMSLTGSTGDLALFLAGSACGSGTNCVASSQDAIGPGAGPETIAAATYAAGTYFLYVDSYYGSGAASCGTYTLSVTGSLPVELLQFEVN